MQMTASTPTTTVDTTPGAPSHGTVDWHQINWDRAHHTVRRLQARIVKATQEGRWGKVHALQHLLTHSFSGQALAVKRVTENQGKKTPGVDHITWDIPEKKATAIGALRQHGYQPQPLRRIYIPKSNGSLRPLGIPTMKDRAMQALYLLALDPVIEVHSDPNSYGFRTERSAADAIEQCFIVLAKADRAEWILEGDIKACFDRISHDWLLAHAPMDKGILHKWLKAGFIERHTLHPTEEGTPQGGICSPVLANFVLNGLEKMLKEHYPNVEGALPRGVTNPKVQVIRYADDFIVTGSSRELLENEVKPLIEQFMRERGLELSQEKTVITHIDQGFDFLGQNVRKYKTGKKRKLLIKPSDKNVKAFLAKVRKIVKGNKQAAAGNLIWQLNPVIRGWALYHRQVVSKRTFQKVDHAIFESLWRWARRRHSNKGARWVRKKYFHTQGDRKWVFSGEIIAAGKKPLPVWLCVAASMPIKRHIKIQGAANPYDPHWEEYFEHRTGVKMANSLVGRRKLLRLWREQGGVCPICNQKITTLTGWHNHHIMWRSKGGADRHENRVLLHPNCHRKVHSQRLVVVKPRPSRGVKEA
jgi:RNA-directed DNA polymerase